HRSYRTLRDGSFGVPCPRHFVPGYDRAVPPGHLPVALTPPYAHGTAPILYQTVSYTCGTGTLRACVPGEGGEGQVGQRKKRGSGRIQGIQGRYDNGGADSSPVADA